MADPELVTIYDDRGDEIGVKSRTAAHDDADWHMIAFAIAARVDEDGRIRTLMQIRSGVDDPYRGHIDLLAAGHVLAGESPIEGVIRECNEETRIVLQEAELLHIGTHFSESLNDRCKRAIQYYYLCRRPILLADVGFSDEASSFVEVDLDELEALVAGERYHIRTIARSHDRPESQFESRVSKDSLSAYSREIVDNFRRMILAVRHTLVTGQIDMKIWQ